MTSNLKPLGGVFLIGFAFIFSAAAQTFNLTKDEDAPPNSGEKVQTPGEATRNVFSTNFFPAAAPQSRLPDAETGDAPDWKLERGAKELNVELGIAPTHPTNFNGREFDTAGRKFALLSLRWGRVIGTAKRVTYEYQIEVAPIALAFRNEVVNPAFQTATATPNEPPTVRQTTYGFAVSPVGFRFLFLPQKRLKPFVALHAGFIFFRQPVPVPDSLSYDFTGDFGGGVQYQIKKNRAVNFGWRYYHISNMNIGKINPGYNAQVFYAGYSFFYK